MTDRQVFYLLVNERAVEKTDAEYKQTVVRLLGKMRLDGEIPFGWIADNTRWMRRPTTYSSLENMFRLTAETYRRALWANQDVYVEVWLEKDALAGVLYKETERWDVPLMVTRGYASLSYLHGAAEAIAAVGKPAFLYYLGDYDPSGVDISRNVEARLRQFAPEADIHFTRIAVTEEQVYAWRLPTRPTKYTDSRSAGFSGRSVEVDAIPPTALRELVRAQIARHIDIGAVQRLEQTEQAERELLRGIAAQFNRRAESNGGVAWP